MQNPAAVSDSIGEWFEIHNAGNKPVDMDGWTIRDDDWDSHVIDNGGPLVIEPSGYLALGRREAAANGGAEVDYIYGIDLILYNADDELVLLDESLDVVDEVRGDDGVTFPDPEGASMSLRPGAKENLNGEDWCTSSSPVGMGDLGKPGSSNVRSLRCLQPRRVRFGRGGPRRRQLPGRPLGLRQAPAEEVAHVHNHDGDYHAPAVPTYDHVVLKDNAKPDVSPIVECVVDNGDGTLTARFGYENRENFDFTLPHGKRNVVTGGPIVGEAIPVAEFHHPHLVDGRPGRTALGEGVFRTTFESYGAVVWQLAGRTATASAKTPRCG